eukprot:scaffold177_cov334-Pavlova_lutheri.AAC.17
MEVREMASNHHVLSSFRWNGPALQRTPPPPHRALSKDRDPVHRDLPRIRSHASRSTEDSIPCIEIYRGFDPMHRDLRKSSMGWGRGRGEGDRRSGHDG